MLLTKCNIELKIYTVINIMINPFTNVYPTYESTHNETNRSAGATSYCCRIQLHFVFVLFHMENINI